MEDYSGNSYEEYRNDFEDMHPKKSRRGLKAVAVVMAALLVIGAVGSGSYIGFNALAERTSRTAAQTAGQPAENAAPTQAASQTTVTPAQQASLSVANTVEKTGEVSASMLDVSDIGKEVKPSVVSVTNTILYTMNYGGRERSETSDAAGSGVIISDNGEQLLIVTNYHVIDASSNSYYYTTSNDGYTVEFIDGTSAAATLRGTDEEQDLAILAVNLSDISEETLSQIRIATIGSSDDLEEGDGLIAIGNALGYGLSVTVGYASALNRTATVNGYEHTYIQTDAAINPGNSGGGLFNTSGQLVGINDAKLVDETVEGVGYAIPISSVTDVITKLMNETPRVAYSDEEKGYLGVYGQDINAQMAAVYNLPEGVYVTYLQEGGPAAEAGIGLRDVISAIGGKTIGGMEDLRTQIAFYAAGEAVELEVWHLTATGEYEQQTITVTLGSYAEAAASGQNQVPNSGR